MKGSERNQPCACGSGVKAKKCVACKPEDPPQVDYSRVSEVGPYEPRAEVYGHRRSFIRPLLAALARSGRL